MESEEGAALWQVVGRLADKPAAEGAQMRGLLVRQGYTDSLMQPADLPLFTRLRPGRILQRQALPCSKPFSQVITSVPPPFWKQLGEHITVCLARRIRWLSMPSMRVWGPGAGRGALEACSAGAPLRFCWR